MTLINTYGLPGDICFDAATFSYRAVIKKPTDKSKPWFTLSMISEEKKMVFDQMLDFFPL